MKTGKFLFSFMLALFVTSLAAAQDCGYYNMSKGMVLGYQNQDAKGKITGTAKTTCLDVSETGQSKVFKVKTEYTDAKNSNLSKREYAMRCEGGKFYVDMQNFVDPKSMEAFKGMEVTVTGNDMEYPAGLSAGQSLPDANVAISAATGGVSLLNLLVNISNRKVVGTETVTVPAGTFECLKITYDVETKMMFKMYSSVVEYINLGAGNVKIDSYDKKGKLLGSTVLTELKK